eukprot:2501387-Amphidinium_carterae.1
MMPPRHFPRPVRERSSHNSKAQEESFEHTLQDSAQSQFAYRLSARSIASAMASVRTSSNSCEDIILEDWKRSSVPTAETKPNR